MNRFLRSAVVLVVALAALLSVGCSGTKSEPTFHTADADDLAMKMIPGPELLPGNSWRVVATNDFGEDEEDAEGEDLAYDEDCEAVVDEVLAPVYEIEEKYEGRAQKEFELGAESRPAADFALTVDVTTQIFADRETAASDLELLRSALSDAKFGECIAGFWETAFSSPDEDGTAVDFDVSATESMARAPRNGVSWAFAGKLHETGQDWFRIEQYQWHIGNATIYVWVLGDSDDVTEEFVSTLLARLDGSANVAVHR